MASPEFQRRPVTPEINLAKKSHPNSHFPSVESTTPAPILERRSLVEQAAEQLRDFIRTQNFRPGDRLPPEPELQQRLEVSRTVLREAIVRLRAIGLINVYQGQGMFVGDADALRNCVLFAHSAMELSVSSLLQFADFRVAIECHAARHAPRVATPADVAALESLLEAMNTDDLALAAMLERDAAFHLKIIAITGNQLMGDIMTLLRTYLLESMKRATSQPRDNRLGYRQHREIFEAIRRGDENAAEQAMRAHMASFQHGLEVIHKETAGALAIGAAQR